MEFEYIKVESSKPKYKSSDDYLVNISEKMWQQGKEVSMFVTSDKRLLERLNGNKCENLMRAKIFMSIVEEKVENIKEIVSIKE